MSRSQKILNLALAMNEHDDSTPNEENGNYEPELFHDLGIPDYSFEFPEFTIENNVVIEEMDDNILSQTSPSKLSTVQPVEMTNGVLLHSLLEIQPNVPQEDNNSQEYLNQSNEQLLGSTVDKSQASEISEISQNNDHIFKSIVLYSDSESESPETHIPVVKRKKHCQVKRSEWKNEIDKKQREQGQEYYGKQKIEGKWKKDKKNPQDDQTSLQMHKKHK
ncbi:hypothetical protein JTB14_033620 [Gonioctena quinquepunctata]|nr:hypothetical protein JTB14_033620 [Gonioctena quinquepunctata]